MPHARSIVSKIISHIESLAPGTVFTPAELINADFGSPAAVRQTLARLARNGTIRRLSHGYYDLPKVSRHIGRLSPSREAIVAAIERKTGATIEPPALDAANMLGLSNQIVAQPAYRTNLTNRRHITIGGQTIDLMPTGPRSLRRDSDVTEQIIDALKALGPRNVTERQIQILRRIVDTPELRDALQRRAKRAPQRVASIVRRITM